MSDPKDMLLTLEDYETAAGLRLPAGPWGYYRSGADSELTLSDNVAAWQRIRLHPRVLVDVTARDARTEILGHPISFPVIVAPTGFQGMAHPEGEVASAGAAGDAGTILTLSTLSNHPVESVVAASAGPVWFQLYVARERSRAHDLVARVEAAGCQALVVTVDAPVLGRRLADARSSFRFPDDLPLPNLHGGAWEMRVAAPAGSSVLEEYVRTTLDASLTWKDIEAFASRTKLPVLVKGIHRSDDARRAFEHGAAGIVVSNHGGRQLDTVPSTAELLRPIVDAVQGQGVILVDGGIRRGTDVLKAVAIGADAVLIGRPVLWGLAVNGRDGVTGVLEILRKELDRAMALTGCPDLSACTRDMLDGPAS